MNSSIPSLLRCDLSKAIVTYPHGQPVMDQWMKGMGQSVANLFSAYIHAGGLVVGDEAGISFTVARTREGGRSRERQITHQGGASRVCPTCQNAVAAHRSSAQQEGAGR